MPLALEPGVLRDADAPSGECRFADMIFACISPLECARFRL